MADTVPILARLLANTFRFQIHMGVGERASRTWESTNCNAIESPPINREVIINDAHNTLNILCDLRLQQAADTKSATGSMLCRFMVRRH